MMLHPSYTDLMRVVNSGVEIGEEPVVNSRYSIVLATADRLSEAMNLLLTISQIKNHCLLPWKKCITAK